VSFMKYGYRHGHQTQHRH